LDEETLEKIKEKFGLMLQNEAAATAEKTEDLAEDLSEQ